MVGVHPLPQIAQIIGTLLVVVYWLFSLLSIIVGLLGVLSVRWQLVLLCLVLQALALSV